MLALRAFPSPRALQPMIRFACHCGFEFEVPQDLAGGEIQCPQCGKLNDVPTLSDVNNLEEGGIFKLGDAPLPPTSRLLAEAHRAFSLQKQDDQGNDIDLRPTVDEFLAAGLDEIPLTVEDESLPGAPKYDPESGELIAPMPVRREPALPQTAYPVGAIPVAQSVISYASGSTARVGVMGIFAELFKPVNVFVMACVVFMHVLLQLAMIGTLAGFWLISPIGIIIMMLLLAHYANVIDETGPTEADELPRPLRDLGWSEDLWGPFTHFFGALMICYWPLFIPAFYGEMSAVEALAVAGFIITYIVFGTFMLPAVLLTTSTSGSVENLTPARLVSVIRACGASYLVAVFGLALAGVVYLAGIAAVNFSLMALFVTKYVYKPLMLGATVATPMLLVGIYLMHFACWYLGKLYRANHVRFNWTMQHHVRTKDRTDTMFQLEKRRAQQMLRAARARQRAVNAGAGGAVPVGPLAAPDPASQLVDPSIEARRARLEQLQQQTEQRQRAQPPPFPPEEPPPPRYDLEL